ncbi:helix-turn-helix transcriptional regulator [Phytoactinopolyspora endophytica]|uniref:helix-turn-helix transcriptional regulator n=1 Tax=Phytoactinopolyspora endophytica TaxID=1642495 RepID=UPI001F115552|nr:AraC family transcriptional regulator [Phytoactinopolyspora endophytica]
MSQLADVRPAGDDTTGGPIIQAWRPAVDGVVEAFHARFLGHAYPAHTHDAWALLIIDDGAIQYDLERHHHGAARSTVTLLPPHVAHDGRSATAHGFRKRVVYLDSTVLGEDLIGAAVDTPAFDDALLRDRVHRLHIALLHPEDAFEAESRLALVRERLTERLLGGARHGRSRDDTPSVVRALGRSGSDGQRVQGAMAEQLRDLLDERFPSGISLAEAAGILHAHPVHLVRSFSAAFGLPPHAYVTGRRMDAARRLLLAGQTPAEVATSVGLYDQSHLTRHFKRYLGINPARYASFRG